jgi:branched-chain amino acid transport system ATP-binding protein
MLEVHQISKWFGGNVVLNNISFNIEKGEVVGLIGPNGAGKTTLFNVITGFYRTKTGFTKFNGQDITRMKPENICALGLCRTFQITKPFSNIPVIKNVMIGEERLSGKESYHSGSKTARDCQGACHLTRAISA